MKTIDPHICRVQCVFAGVLIRFCYIAAPIGAAFFIVPRQRKYCAVRLVILSEVPSE